MTTSDVKCALVLARDLPTGLAVNAAAVLAATLGRRVPGLVGPDVLDGSGQTHLGLTRLPLPILEADRLALSTLRDEALARADLLVVDFTEVAQHARTYPDYEAKLLALPAAELGYLGIALYGPRKLIAKLTGQLPLLRR